MSFPYTPKVQDEKIESLQTQSEYLKLLRLRHLQWMNSADDPQIKAVHLEVAALLEELAAQYHALLDTMQQQS